RSQTCDSWIPHLLDLSSVFGRSVGGVGNKMHKAFLLTIREFPLPEEVPTASEKSSHCQKKRDATAHKIALLLKSSSNCQSKSYDSYAKLVPHEVIEFGDSYKVPANAATTGTASDGTGKKKGRTVTLTTDDMQKRKNDVKTRTTLLLSLPDEHQLRFRKYKTVQELWAVILKTFGGNEATKKTKKNILKQQYGNFKAEGSKTLEQTFNRLQVIVSQLQFMDVDIKQDDLNQKFLTSLAPEWLMGNEEDNTASVSTASTNVPTASANIRVSSISQDTACAYIASQSSGSQIKFEDINQIDEDDMEEIDIKWNMALLSMRADRSRELKYCEKIRVLEINTESRANCIESLTKDLELLKKKKGELETKLTGFQTASKDLDSLLESQRLDKNKEGLGYSDVPPLFAQIYSPPKKDMSWTGLSECADDTVTDYSRLAPTIESFLDVAQNINPSVIETEASPSTISPKPFIKFVKANDSPTKSKTDKVKIAKKPPIKYAEQYRKPTKKPNVRGNQRNWNNLKSHQLGPNFVMEKRHALTVDSGCSRHITGNISYLSDYEPFDRGYASFDQGGCKITGKRTIKTGKLEFENVYLVKDLKYNLFSVSQICDNKNSGLFTDSECMVLGRDFKLLDDANVLLRTPRQHNICRC
nr:ribonuclease H-like domain-containing protein [Tanacetum cinerariifolium]